MNLFKLLYKQVELNSRKPVLVFMFLFYITGSICAQDQESFTIENITARRGEIASGKLMVEKGIDQGTFIPISIIHGAKPGPVLTICAGVHGTEFIPILVSQQLLKEINPKELSGTVILVHIATLPSFTHRDIYLNHVDGKNPNRVYPGKKGGTITERIAYTVTNKIIKRSDYFIDTHGGEFNEEVVDYAYFYYGCPDSELCSKSSMMAHALENHYLIPYKYTPYEKIQEGTYSDEVACSLGIPTVTLEWGDKGSTNIEEIESGKRSLINVMRTIGMLDGDVFKNEHPVYLIHETMVLSNYNGILYTFAHKGQYVTKGTLIGYTTDYWGKVLEKYYSPLTGIISAIQISPTINKGEHIFRVDVPVDHFDE